jgi:hypothetical protein
MASKRWMLGGRLAQIQHNCGSCQNVVLQAVENLVPPIRIERATSGLGNRFHDPTPAYSDSLRPSSQLTPHAALMTVAHLRLAFPIVGMESLEESPPSRLLP